MVAEAAVDIMEAEAVMAAEAMVEEVDLAAVEAVAQVATGVQEAVEAVVDIDMSGCIPTGMISRSCIIFGPRPLWRQGYHPFLFSLSLVFLSSCPLSYFSFVFLPFCLSLLKKELCRRKVPEGSKRELQVTTVYVCLISVPHACGGARVNGLCPSVPSIRAPTKDCNTQTLDNSPAIKHAPPSVRGAVLSLPLGNIAWSPAYSPKSPVLTFPGKKLISSLLAFIPSFLHSFIPSFLHSSAVIHIPFIPPFLPPFTPA